MMTFIITSPIEGVWQLSRPGQRPIEGTAVYEFSHHWECAVHGSWNPETTTREACAHILAVKEAK